MSSLHYRTADRQRRAGAAHRRREVPVWFARLAVTALTAASLGLGFFDLGKRSLWLDEGYTWIIADQNLKSIFSIARTQGYHLIGYYLLIHALIALFGDSSFVMRASSVIAGALCVPFFYLLVARLGGRLAAIYAAVLLVCSEPLVFWQQNARDYSLVVLFAVVSTLALVVGVQTAKLWPWPIWGVVIGIGAYTHPEMLLILPPQMIVGLLWARSWRTRLAMISVIAVGAAAISPILGEASHSSVYQISILQPANYGSATEIASFLASSAAGSLPVTPVDHALLGITFGILLAGAGMLAFDLVERGCSDQNLGLGLSLLWAVLPFVLSWLVSETGHPDFLDRYVILSLPAVAAATALTVVRIQPQMFGLFVVGYLTVFRIGVLQPTYQIPVEDYRGATVDVLEQAKEGDCVTFSSNDGRLLWDYYAAKEVKEHGYYDPPQEMPRAYEGGPNVVLFYNDLPLGYLTYFQSAPYVAEATGICDHMYIVASQYGTPTGTANSRQLYSSYVSLLKGMNRYYRLDDVKDFAGVQIREYTRRAVVAIPSPKRP